MLKRRNLYLLLIVALVLGTVNVMAQDDDGVRVIADFETEELFTAADQFNNGIGHITWGDTAGNVELALAEMERDGETTSVLAVSYDIASWGGFTHALTDGENWISEDWTTHNALQFWLYGNNTGGMVQIDLFDNRNPDLNTDSAERYFFRVADDYEGWQQFSIPFGNFQRRTDFQPGGAPNDGLGLNAVSGYAFGFPAGTGAQTAYLDQVELVTLAVEPVLISDFEIDEIIASTDEFNNGIGLVPWGDTGGNVELRLTDAIRGGEENRALTIEYDISAWGGFSNVLTDGENWISEDWSGYNAMSFWFLGANTGQEIQVEIFDNRNPDSTGDSAERWFYRFVDDSFAWKLVEIPFVDFQRRTDWQPDGAPDDGLNLNAVSGYAFGFPAGTGNKVAFIDDVRLFVMPGVESPDGVAAAAEVVEVEAPPAAELGEVTLNEALLESIPYADPVLIADFEAGVQFVSRTDSIAIGYVPWGDNIGNTVIGTMQILPFTNLAIPTATGPNQVFRIDYDIASWGGFTHAFADGENWVTQDWTAHNALQFWLYGNNTGQIIQVEIFDNLNPEATGDSAERFFFHLLDDYAGWQQFTVPFAHFQRRVDWQPVGALDDGFNLNEVAGYAFGFPGGVGAQSAYIDDIQIVVVEDPSVVQTSGQEVAAEVEIDESIGWDSREWDLMWSDEFDAEAGTPINDEFWTCEVGGHGFGNNQLEFNNDRTENVSHDGNGNLVISAREEALDDASCWYGACSHTSARCNTQDKVEFTYGRVEARIQVPTAQGIWPAFWMLGVEFPSVEWPLSGEIDILEHVGEPNLVYNAIHGPGYSGGSNLGGVYRTDEPVADDFHVYAIDWDENVIRWYVDGELVNLISSNAMNGNTWVYNQDFFMIMNLAVGGFWPGNPDETTEFPQNMVIDYVRVYQLAE